MNNVESSTDSDSSNKAYNINNTNHINNIINNTNNINNIINNSSISDRENKNINISDSENNSIVTDNVVNSSIGENCANLSYFLNNECSNIYVM